ncbi:MAG: CRISPR-associated protein Cas5 [Planctomycetota bacterium]
MNNKKYEVSLEIAGPIAMFTRPDTGAAPVSYPAPTYSATKGIFESVAWYESAYIKPTKVEICHPIRFEKYTTNYGGPLRKGGQIKIGASYQLPAVALIDVCYRLYGEVVDGDTKAAKGKNHLHALQEIFKRRLEKGQFYYTPFLGWKEFTPSYVGSFREKTKVENEVNLVIPSMLISPFVEDITSKNTQIDNNSRYANNVIIDKGVLDYTKMEC